MSPEQMAEASRLRTRLNTWKHGAVLVDGIPLNDMSRDALREDVTAAHALLAALAPKDGHRFGSPPEPVVNPSEAWCDAYADWYHQGRG